MRLSLMLASAMTLLTAFSLPNPSVARAHDAAAANDLSGTYQCQGSKPDGVPYTGTVQIVKNKETYQIRWVFGPREQYMGVGIVSGDVLSVSYFGGAPSVVAYRIQSDDKGTTLMGQWSVMGMTGDVAKETLTRLSRDVTVIPEPEIPEQPRGRIVVSRGSKAA